MLTVEGFKANDLEGYGSEEEGDHQTLFINLNRLASSEQEFEHQTNRDDLTSIPVAVGNDFMTVNPYTKVLDEFPNKLDARDLGQVQVEELIGSGAHAKVFQGTFIGTPVAIKEYDCTSPVSLNAFESELEAFCMKPSDSSTGHIMSHSRIVSVLSAYSMGNKGYLVTELSEYGTLLTLKEQLSFKTKIEALI